MSDLGLQDGHVRNPRGANLPYEDDEREPPPEEGGYLSTWDIAFLIINKMIGTGIFVTPATVVVLVGSKYGAILLWIFGSFYSFISILVYLEYGLAWPFTGGEFNYITKIFPRPALVTATSFAWFFIAFSTSTGNALNFAKYSSLAGANFMVDDPQTKVIDAWQLKFIACWVVVAICLIHYRLIDIGVWANFVLALYKVLLVLILTIATWPGLAHEHGNSGIRGADDWVHFHNRDNPITPVGANSTSSSVNGTVTNTTDVGLSSKDASVNVALAMFLVLYSYQGWENANYITADIEGNPTEKRRKLKKGALLAIATVSFLYIFFNIFFLLLLSNKDIQVAQDKGYSVAYDMALHSFSSGNPDDWSDSYKTQVRKWIFSCIALSAFGNLVGVIFTNGRVKREIANDNLIPGSDFFSSSSTYGRLRDPAGTPTGGLVLHGLATCITITTVSLYPDGSTEGLSFIINLFTYGHSVLGGKSFLNEYCFRPASLLTPLLVALGIGLWRLEKRLKENKTDFDGDLTSRDENSQNRRDPPPPKWDYKMLINPWWRYFCALFFIGINGFLIILPMVRSNLASGKPRRIPNWHLPAVVLPFFAAGAIAGVVITVIATHMEFRTGLSEFATPYGVRRWVIQFPKYWDFWNRWSERKAEGSIWQEAYHRLWVESEASHASRIRAQKWGNSVLELEPQRYIQPRADRYTDREE